MVLQWNKGHRKRLCKSREEVVRECQRSHEREISNDEDERRLRTGKVSKMGKDDEELHK